MDPQNYSILIIEDDLDVAEMLNAYFRVQGYDITTVNWGVDGVRTANETSPDLIILDIRLPDIDGYEVAKQLRTNRKTQTIPIIFLTEKRAREDRLKGLEVGGDDYITKPFDVQELRLRVRNALNRNTQSTLTNPVTNLPDGSLVDEQLTGMLSKSDWGIILITLEHLNIFREAYGFVASDDVLRAVSLMISNLLNESKKTSEYLGHITPTQFLLITHFDNLNTISNELSRRLSQSLDYFYPINDRDENSLKQNRLNVKLSFVTNENGDFENISQLKEYLVQHRK